MKRISIILVFLLTACLTLGHFAAAEERLEIVQARQEGDQLVLYTLLTDAETGAVTASNLTAQQVSAVAGSFGEAQTVSVQTFSESKEGVAYVVAVDLNSYALNATKLSALQDALGVLLNTMRDADRMLLLSIGKTGVKSLSNEFEEDRLTLNTLINGISIEDKYRETRLYQGIERAIGAYSSTESGFPTRKVVLVFTYGVDNGSMAADVLAEKAAKSGVPVYVITMKGKDSQGNVKLVDTADLDRIARASHGRVLDGKTDLTAAVTQFSKYISGTRVVTVKPSQAAWNALATQWSVNLKVGERTVTNDGDGNYAINLLPTPTPAPSASRTVAIVWHDSADQNKERPTSVTAHLLRNNQEVGKALTLSEANSWKGTWDSLDSGSEYSVTLDKVSGYTVTAFVENAQGIWQATATLETSAAVATPTATAVPTRSLTVSLGWEDQDNADNLRPDAVTASLWKNGEDQGDSQTLSASGDWSAKWQSLPSDGATYTVTLSAIDRYTVSEPSEQGDAIAFTASHAPATLAQKLFSPPLLYVVIGVGALLLVLLVLLLTNRKPQADRPETNLNLEDDLDDMPHAPSVMDLTNDERTRPSFDSGEETLGIFTDDAERTLGMEDHRLRIEADIDYQGQKQQQTLLLLSNLTIGRAKESGLVLADPRVSRQHCKLTLKPDGLYVADVGSRSGTFLNDTQVIAETAVKTGDVLTLGTTKVTLTIQK